MAVLVITKTSNAEHIEIIELLENNNFVPMFFIYFKQVWEEAEEP